MKPFRVALLSKDGQENFMEFWKISCLITAIYVNPVCGDLLKQSFPLSVFNVFLPELQTLVLQACSLPDARLLNTSCSRAFWKRQLQKNVSSTQALLQLLDSEEYMRLFFPITNFSSLTRSISSFLLNLLPHSDRIWIILFFLISQEEFCGAIRTQLLKQKYFKLVHDLRWSSIYGISLTPKNHSGATYKWKLHKYI